MNFHSVSSTCWVEETRSSRPTHSRSMKNYFLIQEIIKTRPFRIISRGKSSTPWLLFTEPESCEMSASSTWNVCFPVDADDALLLCSTLYRGNLPYIDRCLAVARQPESIWPTQGKERYFFIYYSPLSLPSR